MTRPSYSAFVVEDETMIRMMLVEMLDELGHTVAAEAGHLEQAVQPANCTAFDFAVLDVNLGGKLSAPVAEILRSRKLPVFSTGYGASGIPPDFADVPSIQKPFTIKALGLVIDELMKDGKR